MGLRTPQDLAANQPQTRPLDRSRVQSIAPTPISSRPLDQLEATVDAQEKERQRALQAKEVKELNLVKSQFNVINDKTRIEAEAKVGSSSGFKTEERRKQEREYLINSLNENLDKFPPKYRAYLELEAKRQENLFDKATYKYSLKQVQEAEQKGLDSQIATGLSDLVTFSGDQRDFSEQLESVRGFVTEKGRSTYGLDDNRVLENGLTVGETIANESKVAVSDGVLRSVVFQAQTAEDLDRAKLLYTNYFDQLTDGDKIKADKAIKQAESSSENRVALDMAAAVLKETGGDLAKAEAMVAADPNVTQGLYSKVMANIKNKNFAEKEQAQRNEDALMSQVYDLASQGKDYMGALKLLDPKKQQEVVDLLNKNNGNPTPTRTDFNVLNKAWNDVYMRGPEVAKDPNFINKLKWSVAPEQLAPIQAEWIRLNRSETNEQLRIQRSSSSQAVAQINSLLDQNRIRDPDIRGKTISNVMAYYNDLVLKNPKMSQREIDIHLNSKFNESFKKETSFSWDFRKGFKSTKKNVEFPREAQVIVDPTWIEHARSLFRARGIQEPTQSQLDKAIKQWEGKYNLSQPMKGKN